MSGGLTEKQRRFVEAYMGGAAGNATAAARMAGYRGCQSTLESVGHENLRKPEVAAAIEERRRSDPAVADRQMRQAFWTRVMTDATVDLRVRLKASELLGKSQGDFVERRAAGAGEDVCAEQRPDEHECEELRAAMRDPEAHEAMLRLADRMTALGCER